MEKPKWRIKRINALFEMFKSSHFKYFEHALGHEVCVHFFIILCAQYSLIFAAIRENKSLLIYKQFCQSSAQNSEQRPSPWQINSWSGFSYIFTCEWWM